LEKQKIRKYVLDSSVVVKWFVDEQDSDKARLLKDGYVAGEVELSAPSLLKYEVINALRWHPTARPDERTLAVTLTALDDFQFLIDPPKEAWIRAIHMSYSFQISPYDGIYLGLARALRSHVVTADKQLIQEVPLSERRDILSLSTMEFD
jgi:predicted nucleic acid-binding protein